MRLCFCLSETSLPALLLAILMRRDVYIVEIIPLIGRSYGFLGKIAEYLYAKGVAKPLASFSSNLPWIDSWPGDSYYNDILATIEDRMQAAFDWSKTPASMIDLTYMMHKSVSDLFQTLIGVLTFELWAREHEPEGSWRICAPPFFYRLMRGLYLNKPIIKNFAIYNIAFNIANSVSAIALSFLWLVRRIHPVVRTESYVLALDILCDDEAVDLLPRLKIDAKDILIVFRSAEFRQSLSAKYAAYRNCLVDEVKVTPLHALRLAAGVLVRQIALLFSFGANKEPALFARLSVLNFKTAANSAFFANYKVANYWGRDDYSLDHGVRNVVLRRLGGKSLGINHGLPINTYSSQWRQIDFDVYFVFGLHLYETYYRKVWPKHMRVVPIGNVRGTSVRLAKASCARSKDVIFFPIECMDLLGVCREVWRVAAAFPDRKLLVKPKGGRSKSFFSTLAHAMKEAPENAVLFDPSTSPYQLMMGASYVITTGSTLSAEALLFKTSSFVLDHTEKLKNFYFRDFPVICCKDGSTIVERIIDIEMGQSPAIDPGLRNLIDFTVIDPAQTIELEIQRSNP